MTNSQVIEKFYEGKTGRSSNGNLYTDGKRLINYSTCIAERINGRIVFNATWYSRTTSIIQRSVYHKYIAETITNVPINTHSLRYYSTIA